MQSTEITDLKRIFMTRLDTLDHILRVAEAQLSDINLSFKKCCFYGITGRVGSGKSGLLGAILQEIPYYTGKFKINGTIAYV